MVGPVKRPGGLPDIIRESDRPIIIYQGYPPNQQDAVAGNSLGLLSWLALLSLCLGVVGFCYWRVLNPAHDREQASVIYPEGRPLGLAKQIEERAQINARAEGLVAFLDRVRSDNLDQRRTRSTHPLLNDPGGIDQLRREWDDMCLSIREGIYERRIGQIEARLAELRRRRALTPDPAEAARLDGEVQGLLRQRSDEASRKKTDSDPALRCTPSAQATVCSEKNGEAWCNPDKVRPGDFVDKAT
ncbi:MAG: hypothetical protein IV086_05460 [Hyphomonadaceae bacterium]|nr:MAG: hypothetical protein FD160_113 [Caulobacteraceae bacterium]MBT9445126.1 hypothetical protein [Hyphomonadaceae bacterium]TPW08450.1 MAG: hypothetical protein FD124_414 [Alphaproteobacteria bacterium]